MEGGTKSINIPLDLLCRSCNYEFVKVVIKKLGPVVRKVDSAITWIVIFSSVVKMLQKL